MEGFEDNGIDLENWGDFFRYFDFLRRSGFIGGGRSSVTDAGFWKLPLMVAPIFRKQEGLRLLHLGIPNRTNRRAICLCRRRNTRLFLHLLMSKILDIQQKQKTF